MGKAVGAFVRFVVTVIIIALLGYNTFETWRLRQEVNALKQARGGTTAAPAVPAVGRSAADAAPLDRLAQARAHTERGRVLLRERRFAEAQRELGLAAQAVRDAGGDARAQSAAAVDSLRTTVERLSAQADSLTGSEASPAAEPPTARGDRDKKGSTER